MIIRNISINNFQSYYGLTEMDFDKGLNLIIGNGGKGKSKLFNAFYWVLFGKIYITDIGWCSTDGLPSSAKMTMKRHEFINKKALHDSKVNDKVSCYVSVEIETDNGDLISVERSVMATRMPNYNWVDALGWEVGQNSVKVSYDTPTGTRVLIDEPAEGKIAETFPSGIRGYIWFQGETLDDLINFRKPENLKDAVKHISYFPFYEKLTDIISKASKRIESQETRHLRELNRQNDAAKSLLSRIEFLRGKLEDEHDKKKRILQDIERIQIALAEDEGKVSGLAKFSEIVTKYDRCEADIQEINFELTRIDDRQRELLPSLWILRNTDFLIERCRKIINERVEEVYTAPEKKYLDNPSRAKLEEILYHDHVCFVCGSPVDDEHPHAVEYIQNRLRMQEEFLREQTEYTRNLEASAKFNIFLGKIHDYPDNLLVDLASIDTQYQKMEEKVEKLKDQRRAKLEAKKKLDAQLEEIKHKHGVDPHREAAQFTTFDNTIKASRSNLERKRKELRNCEEVIRQYNEELQAKDKELNKNGASGGFVSTVEETEWKLISNNLAVICKNVQEKARKELLRKIEERANEFYARFTEHDNGYKGSVVIGDDYSIQYDAGLNTSHEDRKKMSIINALLSLNQEALNIFYPFISDAPTSSFDLSTTHKYLVGIKDIFDQSIIMTKDVEIGSDNYKDIYGDAKVCRVYKLSSMHHTDSIEPEIFEVSTNVERLK